MKNFYKNFFIKVSEIFTFKQLTQNRPTNILFNNLVSTCTCPLVFRYFECAMSAVSGVESSLSNHHLETYFDTEKFCQETNHVQSNHQCICWWKRQQPQGRILITPKSLTEILKSTGIPEFDFLSLDVEGHELEVLESWDFSIPIRVILLETLGVNPQKDELCRQKLISKNYKF